MQIEKEINQTVPFKSAYQKLLVNIMYTYNWIGGKQKDFFKTFDLTPKQYNILRILKGAGKPITVITIRKRMLDKMSDASRIVDRLIKKGLVVKTVSINDKRRVDISLTQEAEEILNRVEINLPLLENGFKSISEEEALELSALLDKMRP